MKSPFTGKEMTLQKEKSVLTFRKEEFEYIYYYYLCNDTGEHVTTTELDDLNVNQVYNKYRANHNIPFPDEILNFRKKFQISYNKMSQLLGLGPNSYSNYEKGEVPSVSIGTLLHTIINRVDAFKDLIRNSKEISDDEKKVILKKIEIIEAEETNKKFILEKYLNLSCGETNPCLYTGYRKPNIEKLSQMVMYFTEKLRPTKTAMNKLLFYADFLSFKRKAFSISGTSYMAHLYGPVPVKFQTIYEHLEDQNYVGLKLIDYGNGYVGEQFVPNNFHRFNLELFDSSEIEIMEVVVENFREKNATQIMNLSHQESAWIDNEKSKSLIDYNYSFDLIHC